MMIHVWLPFFDRMSSFTWDQSMMVYFISLSIVRPYEEVRVHHSVVVLIVHLWTHSLRNHSKMHGERISNVIASQTFVEILNCIHERLRLLFSLDHTDTLMNRLYMRTWTYSFLLVFNRFSSNSMWLPKENATNDVIPIVFGHRYLFVAFNRFGIDDVSK
jgi:hypothetical protein